MAIFGKGKTITELQTTLKETEKQLDEFKTLAKSLTFQDPALARLMNWNNPKTTEQLTSPYRQLAAVHSCIKWKARNFAQPPFRIYRGDVEVVTGSVYELFQNINPSMDKFQFQEGISTSLDIGGNAYIILDESVSNGVPSHLWLFNPNWVTPAFTGQGEWTGWWLERPGARKKEFILPERVIQVKYYNPNNEILGMSPLDVLRITGQTMWDAQNYNKKFFENDATPNLVYINEKPISPRKLEQLQKEFEEDRKGVDKSNGTMTLTGGWDVKAVGLSQKDIQFLELMKAGLQDIAMVYGVPKKILGLYEDINMATAISAELQFWEDTIMPIARMTEAAINKGLLNGLGYEGRYDFSVIDVLNQRVMEKVDSVVKLLATGQYTRNELNDKFKLGFEDAEWGNEPVVINTQPQQMTLSASKAPSLSWPVPEVEELSTFEGVQAAKWIKQTAPLVPMQDKAAKAIRDYFHGVEQKIFKTILKKVDGNYSRKALDDELPLNEIEAAFSDQELYDALEQYLKDAMNAGAVSLLGEGFQLDNNDAIAIERLTKIKLNEVNDNAYKSIVDTLENVLEEALSEGQGEAEISRRIVEALGEKMKHIKSNAKTIARTEVNASFSQSRAIIVDRDPPKFVRWISSRDSRVRDTHRSLDGDVVDYGKTFSNGLKYPHDPNGSAGEVINCRCTWEPVYRIGG